jgi:zinc/manganese transport system ATP-binding protein
VSAICFEQATLALGSRIVLRDVSFTIEPGEFIGVLGPNGAGKTTMMRAVLGLVAPSAGRIAVLGAPAWRGNARIGYMPQVRGAAAWRLSGYDFVAAACDGHRWGLPRLGRTAHADVARALALVGATTLAARPLGELSGGERQRLLLAQALLGDPAVLLLDEPLAGLDPRYQGGVVDLVRDLQRQLGITVLFSAHELNPLLGALDRVLYLGAGHAALGTVAQVITAPVLSRLYGTPIDVVQAAGRLFVMAGNQVLDHEGHHHHEHAPHA